MNCARLLLVAAFYVLPVTNSISAPDDTSLLKGGSFEFGHKYAFDITNGQIQKFLESQFTPVFESQTIPKDSIKIRSTLQSLRLIGAFMPMGTMYEASYFRSLKFAIVENERTHRVQCTLTINADLNWIEVSGCTVAGGMDISKLSPDTKFIEAPDPTRSRGFS